MSLGPRSINLPWGHTHTHTYTESGRECTVLPDRLTHCICTYVCVGHVIIVLVRASGREVAGVVDSDASCKGERRQDECLCLYVCDAIRSVCPSLSNLCTYI